MGGQGREDGSVMIKDLHACQQGVRTVKPTCQTARVRDTSLYYGFMQVGMRAWMWNTIARPELCYSTAGLSRKLPTHCRSFGSLLLPTSK